MRGEGNARGRGRTPPCVDPEPLNGHFKGVKNGKFYRKRGKPVAKEEKG